MDLRQLRVFAEIARQGSFTRAAESLHVAQPAVSMTLRKLEEELDLVLFSRREKRVVLTAEGERLLFHAERLLDNLAAAETEMVELHGLERGEVRIGIPPMLSSYYFPQIIHDFRGRYPRLRLAVNGEGADSIQRMISRGELDIGVIAGTQLLPGLESRRLLREEIVACVPCGHPLALRPTVSLREFCAHPLILFKEGYHMRELLDELIEAEGLTPQVVFETNLFSLVRSLIKLELGISTFLRMVVSGDAELVAIPFDPPLHLDLMIAWKEDRHLSRANRAFIDFLLELSRATAG